MSNGEAEAERYSQVFDEMPDEIHSLKEAAEASKLLADERIVFDGDKVLTQEAFDRAVYTINKFAKQKTMMRRVLEDLEWSLDDACPICCRDRAEGHWAYCELYVAMNWPIGNWKSGEKEAVDND